MADGRNHTTWLQRRRPHSWLELSELCVMQRQALGTETETKQSFQGRLGDLTAKAHLKMEELRESQHLGG